jgi:hypothetical protein
MRAHRRREGERLILSRGERSGRLPMRGSESGRPGPVGNLRRGVPLASTLILTYFVSCTPTLLSAQPWEVGIQDALAAGDWYQVFNSARCQCALQPDSRVGHWLLGHSGGAIGDYRAAERRFANLDGEDASTRLLEWAKSFERLIQPELRPRCSWAMPWSGGQSFTGPLAGC